MKEKNLSIKRYMMAIFGTLVLGAVGAAITHYFQDRSWDHQQEAPKREEEQKNATAIFEALSTATDERHYAMKLAYCGASSPINTTKKK